MKRGYPDPFRASLLKRFPKARLHRLEDGRAQIINPVGKGQFEALGPAIGSRYEPGVSAKRAWYAASEQQDGKP